MENLVREVSKIRDVKKRRAYLRKRGVKEPELSRMLDEAHFLVKGKEKFPRAAQMKFDRDGLAQASSKTVAEYRTWKMRNRLGVIRSALDVGSGIGGDTIAMALRWKVLSVDMDPVKVEMLRHNIKVYNVTDNVEVIQGDIYDLLKDPEFQVKTSDLDVIFFAHSRRQGWRRTVKFEEYQPPLSLIEKLVDICPNVCATIAPAADLSKIKYDCDIEIISNKGEVKEAVLWFGRLKHAPGKRSLIATKLPERITWVKEKTDPIDVSEPGEYLYEPDPAYVKAQMVNNLAKEYNLTLLHPTIAYLTGDKHVKSPLLKPHRVLAVTGIQYTEINRELNHLNLGSVDSKSRGVNVDHNEVRRKVRGTGFTRGVVVYTLVGGEPKALICRYAD